MTQNGNVDVPVDIFGNPLSESDQRLLDRITSDESLLDSLNPIPNLGDLLPALETVAVILGNVVIGLAGATLIAFGAITALSGTRAAGLVAGLK